jgi:hypothetical protein
MSHKLPLDFRPEFAKQRAGGLFWQIGAQMGPFSASLAALADR